jgi:hypothetical protein
MHPVIGRCPVCSDELTVSRLNCPTCGTTVEGTFSLGRMQRLNQPQLQFIESFIRCRGSMKDVGSELNMSYPTVNNRLNDVLIAMGYADRVKVPEEAAAPSITGERKREILTELREGKITAADAERMLRGQEQEAVHGNG